jgi:tRNA nucleotidyltransferase/poly(A) polymerase
MKIEPETPDNTVTETAITAISAIVQRAAPIFSAITFPIEARLVGGCVRDALLGRPCADIDLAINVPPEQATYVFSNAKVIPTGASHGTITVITNDGTQFEITSLRQDVCTDGRHAIVEYTTDWKKDAARRDFTINALYADQNGQIYDYFGGISDLEHGIIRFIGDPTARINEDYLRILRFYRFALRFGHCDQLDQPSLQAVKAQVQKLEFLSKERVQSELLKILADKDPLKILQMMIDVFNVLFGGPPDLTSELLTGIAPPLLRLFALYPHDSTIFRHKLKLSRNQMKFLTAMTVLKDIRFTPETLLNIRLTHGDNVALGWFNWATSNPLDFFDEQAPAFPLTGRDLISEDMMPGPALGKLLQQCQEWWCERGGQPSREECLNWCRKQT